MIVINSWTILIVFTWLCFCSSLSLYLVCSVHTHNCINWWIKKINKLELSWAKLSTQIVIPAKSRWLSNNTLRVRLLFYWIGFVFKLILEFIRSTQTTLLFMFRLQNEKFILFRVVSGVGWCRVAGLAETITNSVKLKLKLRLSLAINV